MTITITLARPPLQIAVEVGSFSEGVGMIESSLSDITKMFDLVQSATDAPATGADAPAVKERKKRGSGTAEAPAPIPVPSTPAAPADPLAIPAALDRSNPNAVVNQPAPPPLMPAAPPIAPPAPPAPPPTGAVAAKVIAYIESKKGPDGGAAWVEWLAGAGLTVPKATFEEAMTTVRLTTDEKLAPIATALSL